MVLAGDAAGVEEAGVALEAGDVFVRGNLRISDEPWVAKSRFAWMWLISRVSASE